MDQGLGAECGDGSRKAISEAKYFSCLLHVSIQLVLTELCRLPQEAMSSSYKTNGQGLLLSGRWLLTFSPYPNLV